jgi:hypothetical protein
MLLTRGIIRRSKNIKEAIELHIEGLMDDHELVPVENDLIIGRIQVTHIEA